MTVKTFEQRLPEAAQEIVDLVAGKVDTGDPDELAFGFTMLMAATVAWARRCNWTPEAYRDVLLFTADDLAAELAKLQEESKP